ncbi:hypothetical protein MMC06_000930 [Schaereria dolodes]|nr:hypothetical protein [Schaereria dolodes]
MHGLIFVNPTLNKHDKKRFDYIIDARKLYFDTHNQFQAAYRSLQDLYAHSVTLDKQKAEYESQGLMDLENMRYNERARALTLREMRSLLPEMMKLHRKRTDVAIYFSDMKLKFLQTDVPRLVYIGRKVYQRAMGLDRTLTTNGACSGKVKPSERSWERYDVVLAGVCLGIDILAQIVCKAAGRTGS